VFGFLKKEKGGNGPLGYYDIKQFHSLEFALIYANEELIIENENCKVFSRVYKDCTFVNVLVHEEIGFDINEYKFSNLEKILEEKGFEKTKNKLVFIIFKNKTDDTIRLAKSFCNSDKHYYEQACVYNEQRVKLEYYKPVPNFYKVYDYFCENLYFDKAAIDHDRE
jgi:hypothetical protein